MRRWNLAFLCAAAVAVLPAEAAHHAKAHRAPATPHMQIAITFDDLPDHGPLPPDTTRAEIARRIVTTLHQYHVPPTYGFTNAHWLKDDPSSVAVLKIWRAAGNPLGNHTLTHMDPNTNTVEAFENDLLEDEPTLEHDMGKHDWHWLRMPFLHEGDTPEKREALAQFITSHHYHIAQVTLSFADYAYNEPYARCMEKGDKDAVDWLKDSYLDGASVDMLAGRAMAESLYGRDIKHVLLMHIGAFDSIMLPKLLEMYKKRGVEFISLADAERDPAYQGWLDQRYGWGGTMLQEQMAARNLTPPAFADNKGLFRKLDQLCR